MDKNEFNSLLKHAGLSKKEFAEMTGMSSGAVNNWGGAYPIPPWVDSWLENYRKAHKFDIIHKLFDEEIGREKKG